ncbi:MAG: CGNR zinc finger domain-containing protein [Dehalococcoidia bacterium]
MHEADGTLLLAFLNTTFAGTERIATPADYSRWLREHGVLPAGTHLNAHDVEVAHRLRDALRSVIRGNACGDVDPNDVPTLNGFAATLPLRVRFTPSGGVNLEATESGVAGFHAAVLGAVFREELRGEWRRYKLCRNPDCEWAFFDESRNRSRLWCEMQTCGARAKMRAYRSRRAAT